MPALDALFALVTVLACCRYLWRQPRANPVLPAAVGLIAIAVLSRSVYLLLP